MHSRSNSGHCDVGIHGFSTGAGSHAVKCARCPFMGSIGIDLTGRENGMIPGTHIKRIDYLCVECLNRPAIDDRLPPREDRQ